MDTWPTGLPSAQPGPPAAPLKTPHGAFSLPYTSEETGESQPGSHPRGPDTVVPHASVRFAGTGFAVAEPIVFTFANSADLADAFQVRIAAEDVQIVVPTGLWSGVWRFKADGTVTGP